MINKLIRTRQQFLYVFQVDDPNHTGVELVTDYAKREGQRKRNLLRELVCRTF